MICDLLATMEAAWIPEPGRVVEVDQCSPRSALYSKTDPLPSALRARTMAYGEPGSANVTGPEGIREPSIACLVHVRPASSLL